MNRNRNRIVTVVVSLALAAVILLLSRSGISPGGERLEVLKTTILEECKADAIVVWAGNKTLVIDAGEEEDGEEVGKFLADQGVHTLQTKDGSITVLSDGLTLEVRQDIN
ncbi:hypothetical protein [Oribacterium sp. Sow4_G1_1]|jgi:hypothetical protein|uniref:hypothetical protein n=1 Tax=Oribacterium sp. Sow4_G1_1 TaxID=3438794 RepID=UPI003F9CB419